VLLEAMAAGLAIISTDSGPGVRSLLGGYSRATLCPSGAVTPFAAAIAGPVIEHIPATAFNPAVYTVEEGARRYVDAFASIRALAGEHRWSPLHPVTAEPALLPARIHHVPEERRRAAND